MSKGKFKPFDYDYYIQRNKEVAMRTFGQLMDENRNIAGTDYYFDELWRLRKRKEVRSDDKVY